MRLLCCLGAFAWLWHKDTGICFHIKPNKHGLYIMYTYMCVYIYREIYYSAMKRNRNLMYNTTWINLEECASWNKLDTKGQI